LTERAFVLESFQAPDMEAGSDRVDAIVSITATTALAQAGPDLTVGIILATSSRMAGSPLAVVRPALRTVLAGLRDSDRFFVVSFAALARTAVAPAAAKSATLAAVDALRPAGPASVSQGLGAARSLFASGATNYAALIVLDADVTDRRELLAAELNQCASTFTCDCWAVGGPLSAGSLLPVVARTMRGGAASVTTGDELASGILAGADRARASAVGPLRLRIDAGPGVTMTGCRQVSPVEAALPPEFETARWVPGESRDYQVTLRVPPTEAGEEIVAAQVGVVLADERVSPTVQIHARRP
jgi:hypothetical protein